jgi:hypothetical protein
MGEDDTHHPILCSEYTNRTHLAFPSNVSRCLAILRTTANSSDASRQLSITFELVAPTKQSDPTSDRHRFRRIPFRFISFHFISLFTSCLSIIYPIQSNNMVLLFYPFFFLSFNFITNPFLRISSHSYRFAIIQNIFLLLTPVTILSTSPIRLSDTSFRLSDRRSIKRSCILPLELENYTTFPLQIVTVLEL